jgi:hypothetical protein
MSDAALDIEGDLDTTGDQLSLVVDDDAIVQHLEIRFQFVFEEWFLDIRLGIPYFGEILIKNPDLTRVRGIFRQTILTTPGIAQIEEFSLDFEGAIRKLSTDFLARKTDGEILEFNKEFIIS